MTALSGRVLLVEDDEPLRLATEQGLELAGLSVRAFPTAEGALAALGEDTDDVLLTDVRLPRMDGLQLMAAVRASDPDLPVVLVTGHGDVPMAVAALKDGAFDFLTKPFAIDHLAAVVARAAERRQLVLENRRLRAAADAAAGAGPLLGESAAIVRLRDDIRRLAEADLDVLVEGETGTGKDLVAAMLHRQGPRARRPMVTVDCAALSDALAEAELFGHEADSVAHTRRSRRGLAAASDGGTLLLDGVDALGPPLQAKLLRMLEDREVRPIGATRAEPLNLHVVATARVDLGAAADAGAFRADLLHRLALTRLRVPPLRERGTDRMLLFATFVAEAQDRLNCAAPSPSDAVRRRLHAYDWPGNVRELRNYAYEVVLGSGDPAGGGDELGLKERVATFEAEAMANALSSTGGNVSRAMLLLRLPRKTFYEKLARHGLDPDSFRS